MDFKFETGQKVIGRTLYVSFSDGTTKTYDAIELGCIWFKMTNDEFYNHYGFNFNPHKWGLYQKCRKLVHGEHA